jgi:hypothetical protein
VHPEQRDGRTYWYFRRGQAPRIKLPDPGARGFHAAYAAALAGESGPERTRGAQGQLAALCGAALGSDRVKLVSPSDRAMVRRHCDYLSTDKKGRAPIRSLRERHNRADLAVAENPTDRPMA